METDTHTEPLAIPTGQYLKDRREAIGLTLRDLDKKTGINFATLSQYENGMKIRPQHAFLLAAFWGIDSRLLWTPPQLPTVQES